MVSIPVISGPPQSPRLPVIRSVGSAGRLGGSGDRSPRPQVPSAVRVRVAAVCGSVFPTPREAETKAGGRRSTLAAAPRFALLLPNSQRQRPAMELRGAGRGQLAGGGGARGGPGRVGAGPEGAEGRGAGARVCERECECEGGRPLV